MKRFAVSSLTALCGILLTTTAHASFIEKSFVDNPDWKTQEEVDASSETRMDARTAMPETMHTTETVDQFDATDDGDATFGEQLKNEEIHFDATTSVTRAEFTAMLVRARYSQESINWCYWDVTSVWPPKFELLFRDVPVDHEFAPEICVAMRDGLVRGYGNDIFRPDALITFADAAKMLARSNGLTPWADPSQPKHWFDIYVTALGARNAIPTSVESIDERITPVEAREMIRRLEENDTSRTSRSAEELITAWEKKYERPVVRPVVTIRVPVKPASSAPATQMSSSSSSTASVKQSSSTMSSTEMDEESSRPKAWYEF